MIITSMKLPQMSLVFSGVSEYGNTEPCKYVISEENANNNLENIFHNVFPTDIRSPKKARKIVNSNINRQSIMF